MELRTENGQLKLGGAFKLVAVGYFLGAGAIFVPFFALATLVSLFSGLPVTFNGEVVEGSGSFLLGLMPILILPVVLAMQSVMFGGLAVLGLWLYQKVRPIRVVGQEDVIQ